MNALSHSKFTLPLEILIKADIDFYNACVDADRAGLPEPEGGSPTHDLIMRYKCRTIADVRAKLAWMQTDGGNMAGEDEGYRLLLEDLDDLMAQ